MKYLPPVGTADERASGKFPPGKWFDANPYGHPYAAPSGDAYHTGLDLNLNWPRWDADAHQPVYAIADGVVTCAQNFPVWGNIVVVDHGEIMARYAHMEVMLVGVGQRVTQTEQLGRVGNADGKQPYHLHFDISHTRILRDKPNHWPKLDRAALLANYLDPVKFYAAQGIPEEIPMALAIQKLKNITGVINVRNLPEADDKIAPKVGQIAAGQVVETRKEIARVVNGDYTWVYVTFESVVKGEKKLVTGWAAAETRTGVVWLKEDF